MPYLESMMPSSPLQHRYSTRRPPISPPPEPSVRRVPPKRARTSGPGETSSQALANSQTREDIQRPSDIALEVIIKRPMVTAPPILGNLDCRAKPFHSELYFDMEAMQQQPCHTPIFFFLMIIIIYSSTKQLILKYSISALKNLNVEFLLEFVQKEDMENLL